MVAFGAVKRQSKDKSYFGSKVKTTKGFGKFQKYDDFVLPDVKPENHPLIQHADTYLKASYSDTDAVKKMIALGYSKDKELSNIETHVWVKNGRPLILHRGSSNAKDFLVSDVLLGLNLSGIDPRAMDAKKITQRAQEKYGRVADHSGHSLGAFLAEYSADDTAYVLTYNKGTSPFHINKRISPRQLDLRASGDLVSWFAQYQNGNQITIANKGKGFLDAHNLNNLD
jgi:hypothetical protein